MTPYGTVALTQDVDGISVDISVTLDPFNTTQDYRFHEQNSSQKTHYALAFDIVGAPTVTFSNVTAGFTPQSPSPGSYSPSPFGTFEYALKCTGCGAGYAGGLSGPLDLTVTPVSGALTPSSFMPAGALHFFSVDVVDPNNFSGNVADPGGAEPEPATFVLIGTALVALSLLKRIYARHL